MGITRAMIGGLAAIGVAAGVASLPQNAWAANDGLPDGSWRESCERPYIQNGTLYALCRRDGNRFEFASAEVGSCRAFGNRNGTLFCESGSAGAGNGANVGQWSGSFLDSCRDAKVGKQGKLQAICRNEKGTYKRSNLQPRNCPSYRAGNSNGKLVCEAAGDGSNVANRWNGSFSQSCRDVSMNSNGVLTATCRTMNGNWNRTNLSPRQCGSYQAGNRDGNLVCEDAVGGSNGSNRWGGSFSQSCRDVSMNSNGVLTATCRTMNGNWNRTSLSPRQCGGYQAGNRDGNLFCEQ